MNFLVSLPRRTTSSALSPADPTAPATTTAYTVTRYDIYNNLVTSSAQVVYLYTSQAVGNSEFTEALTPSPAVTQITIADTQSVATFYYWSDTAGTYTITASDATPVPDGATGIADGTDSITFN